MKAGLYADNTIPISLDSLCEMLNSLCKAIEFSSGSQPFRVDTAKIASPTDAEMHSSELQAESASFDISFLATNVPYDNNYFFMSSGKRIVISFNGWNTLTALPIANGLVYFIASIVLSDLDVGSPHDEMTGCVNDFLWDKRGVDVGMRAAFICDSCLATAPKDERACAVVADVQAMLDVVSRASRVGADVVLTGLQDAGTSSFDVFLCHSSADKPAVREIDRRLRDAGIRTWLDEDQVPLGLPWQPVLEASIQDINSAMVLVGPSGQGPWQRAEIWAILDEFMRRSCPVIPVILPEASGGPPELPLFLRQMMWLDLRQEYDSNVEKLIHALARGTRPG